MCLRLLVCEDACGVCVSSYTCVCVCVRTSQPVRYPMQPSSSRSHMFDYISQEDSPRFPLYSRGVEPTRFKYAVLLLNKNIEQVRVCVCELCLSCVCVCGMFVCVSSTCVCAWCVCVCMCVYVTFSYPTPAASASLNLATHSRISINCYSLPRSYPSRPQPLRLNRKREKRSHSWDIKGALTWIDTHTHTLSLSHTHTHTHTHITHHTDPPTDS